MMPGVTANGYPYPTPDDKYEILPDTIQSFAEAVDTDVHTTIQHAFSAHLNTQHSSAASTQAIVKNDTIDFDSDNGFDVAAFKYTPKIAGLWLFVGQVWILSPMNDQERIGIYLWKNGGQEKNMGFFNSSGTVDTNHLNGSAFSYANGTTDYFQLAVYTSNTRTIGAGFVETYFQGSLG
jgi:hypothetical protein